MALPNSVEDRDAQTIESVYSGAGSLRRPRGHEDSPRDQRGSLLVFCFYFFALLDFLATFAGAAVARFIALAKRDFLRAALFG